MAKTIDIDIKVNAPTLKELRANLKELKTDVADATNNTVIKKFNKEIDNLNKTIKEVVESGSDLGATFEEVYGDLMPLSTQISEAEDRLYQLASAGKANTEEFKKLTTQTAKNKQLILETDKAVDLLANNRGLASFGTNIKDIGASLLTLDFKSANDQATALATSAKNISFKDAMGSVKALGSTFAQLGKALLTNPLFLIGGALTLLGVIIYKLLDKLGLFKVIMDAVGKVTEYLSDAIDALIQPLKDLTDWLGWTSHAAEESADKQAKSSKKVADAVELNGNRQIQTLDNQIRKAKAEGKETTQLERQKVVLLAETAKARYDEAKAAFEAAVLKGDLDAKELSDLKQKAVLLKDASKQAREEISLFDVEKNAEKNAKIAANDKEAADARSAAWAKRKGEIEENKAFQLKTSREIKDIELSLIEDETEKALAINKEKFARLKADTESNDKLSLDQRKTFLALFNEQEQAVIDEINTKKKEKEIKAQEEVDTLLAELRMTSEEKEFAEIDAKYDAKKQKLIDNATEEYKLTEEYINALAMLDAKAEADKQAIIDDKAKKKKEKENEEAILELEKNVNTLAGQKALLDEQMRQELENKELTEEQKLEIEKRYRDMKTAADLEAVSNTLNQVQGGLDAAFALGELFGKKDEAAKEKRAKRQFQIQKAMSLSMAVVDGIKAVQSSIAQSPIAIGPIPNPAGIASLAFAVSTSVASIAKIASSQYKSSGGAAPAAATPNIPTADSSSATPSFNMFGNGNEENNLSSATDREATQNINVNASISVDEVTDKQKNLARINESGTLSL